MPTSHLAPRMLIALLLSGLGTAYSQAPTSKPVKNLGREKLFAYDRSKDFDLKVASSKDEAGGTVQDVDYAGANPRGRRVKAYLISPMGDGPFPAVLCFHCVVRIRARAADCARASASLGEERSPA